jgi:hypothetical protein
VLLALVQLGDRRDRRRAGDASAAATALQLDQDLGGWQHRAGGERREL